MNRHVHADKIIAKAENMDLVVLHRFNDHDWFESGVNWCDSFSFLIDYDYFLCLEEHREACLHWLNGGEIEERGFYNDDGNFSEIKIFRAGNWNPNHIFMSDKSEFRIKPKKEKRYIATFPWCGNNGYVTPSFFKSIGNLDEYVHLHYGVRDSIQIIEIEVEV